MTTNPAHNANAAALFEGLLEDYADDATVTALSFISDKTGETHHRSYAQLKQDVRQLADVFAQQQISCVALLADNGYAWIVADLACLHAGVRCVPLPLFFSDEQLLHAVSVCQPDALLKDAHTATVSSVLDPLFGLSLGNARDGSEGQTLEFNDGHARIATLQLYQASSTMPTDAVPDTTQKITFTSGSTGDPKGVCLSVAQQFNVAQSLVERIGLSQPRHLCVLPLSTLLENVAGVYAPLLCRGTVLTPSLASVGFEGSRLVAPQAFLQALHQYQPHTLILIPQLLQLLLGACAQGWQPPASLRFIAVGGGTVSPLLLQQAHALGLPVFEGYGLSECASVVALNSPKRMENSPEMQRLDASGKPLAHVHVAIEDGEIIVQGNTFLGYAGMPETWGQDRVATGDLGALTEDGFVQIFGRRKNVLVSSFGRNISPEWVEAELISCGMLREVVVFGDARPYCIALLTPLMPIHSEAQKNALTQAIHSINQRLPDYARIQAWAVLPQPLSEADGLLTANGRPKRDQIQTVYQPLIHALYGDGDTEHALTNIPHYFYCLQSNEPANEGCTP